MTPAQMIRPFLEQADREHPELKVDNRFASCFTLLKNTIEKAGPDWAFVGKTSMDGGMYTPPGFQPITMTVPREDGQMVPISIIGLSMDAIWHLPTRKQVKLIANSTANEPGPWEHGPAHLDPYDIDEFNQATGQRQYRWHNPPVLQGALMSGAPQPGQPVPQTPRPASLHLPSYAELGDDAFFSGKIGQALFEDMHANGEEMNAGSAGWIARAVHGCIERFLINGDHRDAPAIVKKVRNEWRQVMNNPALPQIP